MNFHGATYTYILDPGSRPPWLDPLLVCLVGCA